MANSATATVPASAFGQPAATYPSTLPNDPYWPADLAAAQTNRNHFAEPADNVNYTDYCYVGTHNAFTYPYFYPTVHQQDQTIIGQLEFGVRGLMLDTHDWKSGIIGTRVGTGSVVLSHDTPGSFITTAHKAPNLEYQTLKFELRRVVEFLKVHPQSIVTIILEDYANPATTADEINQVLTEAGLPDKLILRPGDLHGGPFPTLGWMRQNNRRLIIFTQNAATTAVTFSEFVYCFENAYGTSDENALTTDRAESARVPANVPRSLVVFNNFPGPGQGSGVTPTVGMQKDRVEYGAADHLISLAQIRGFAGRRPANGYWADIVTSCVTELEREGKKTIFDYANHENAPDGPLVESHVGYVFTLASNTTHQLAKCHQTHSGGTYYGWCEGHRCRHFLEVQSGAQGHLNPNDTVFIRTSEADMGAYVYLNAETQFNLWYSNNAKGDEKWAVERVDSGTGPIRKGEKVRLKSLRQSTDKGVPMYLSGEHGDSKWYLGTRPNEADGGTANLGIDWIITSA